MPGLRSRVPWQAKLVTKLVLTHLPVPYAVWRRLSVFRWGRMDDPGFAVRSTLAHLRAISPPTGFTMLELGPGDSIASALVARALGAERSYLVDAGQYAQRAPSSYRELSRALDQEKLELAPVAEAATLDELLSAVEASYLTDGLQSLRSLPDASVDVCWSNAVLEHVRLDEVEETLGELGRIVRGRMSHQIDLRDHLADSLNNLRFSRRIWESRLIAASGYYTNRLRASDWVRLFEASGFHVLREDRETWSKPPLSREALDPEFRAASESDLLTSSIRIIAQREDSPSRPVSEAAATASPPDT